MSMIHWVKSLLVLTIWYSYERTAVNLGELSKSYYILHTFRCLSYKRRAKDNPDGLKIPLNRQRLYGIVRR